MAKYGSDQVGFFLVDGFSMLGSVTQFEGPAIESTIKETTPFSTQWPTQTPVGMRKATLSQEGFYDDDANEVHAAISALQDVSRVVCLSLHANTAGNKFDGYAGSYAAKYRRVTGREDLHQAKAEYVVSGQVDEDGHIIQPRATKTADFTSAVHDNTASSPDGAAGYLQVSDLALGGHTNLTVKLRHSADNSTYADLITFTAVTGTNAAERKTVSGTVNRYIKAEGDFTGAGTPTAKVFVGIKRLVAGA